MSSGGIRHIAGSMPFSAGGEIAVKPPLSGEVATKASQVDLRALSRAGWVDGTVNAINERGSIQVQTRLGILSLQVRNLGLEVGARLKLSFDAQTGRVSFQAPSPPEVAAQTGAPQAAQGAQQAQKPSLASSTTTSLNQSLLNAGTVERVVGTPVSQDATMRTLAAIFPHSNANSFALAAALFPIVVRGGAFNGLVNRKTGAYNGDTRLMALARKISTRPVAPLDDDFGYMSWNMPFFHQGGTSDVEFTQRQETSLEDPSNQMVRTILKGSFTQLGRICVEVLLDADLVTVECASEARPSDGLMADLDRIANVFGMTFGFRMSLLFKWGDDAHDLLGSPAS